MRLCSTEMMISIAALALLAACERQAGGTDFEVTATFPHDATAYTQGFLTSGDDVFESTGQYGRSDVRRVDLRTGTVLARRALPASHFGEGLALFAGQLYQLTWKEAVVYVYDPASLDLRDSLPLLGEGWGLTADDQHLFLSDGSDSLRVVDAKSFSSVRVLHVRYRGAPLRMLNELEYYRGAILANVYETNWVAVIDPETGEVTRMLDFADLYPRRPPGAEVMNGIAVAPDRDELLLTGKFWPIVFQVRLNAPSDSL
jgi:glutamine cyclotransferase